MILFKKLKQNHINIFCKRYFWIYALIAVVSFVFIKTAFTNKAYTLNASSVCAADLIYVVKENPLFLPLIASAFLYIGIKELEHSFSYNVILRYTERKQMYKSQLLDVVLNSAILALFVTTLLCAESVMLTKSPMNWNVQNSYYVFMNGNTYNHTLLLFVALIFVYVFSFVCTQMLIALYFLWRKINAVYTFFVLFAFVGLIMLINRAKSMLNCDSYGITILNVLPYIAVFVITLLLSLLVVMNKTVLKREFV